MIFKPNMIVVLTNGRLAGKKAVVVGEIDEHTIVVAGVNRLPSPSEDYMPTWQKKKNEKFLTFIKKVNIHHVLATCFKADIGLPKMEAAEIIADLAAKKAANEETERCMRAAYEAKKAKFLFTALKF